MNTQTQTPASNDLHHTINTHDADGNTMRIKIRLNDECKNGHQDFAITADIWQKGKPQIDKWQIMGGSCHDVILKARPDLKIFVDLHLCDYKGIPTYAVENGFYHLQEGFNDVKPDSTEFKAKFCQYYRVWGWQFDRLLQSENQIQFSMLLKDLNILDQWENDAKEAIQILEKMTGTKFIVDSKRTQYNAPTHEQMEEEKQKQARGYYTPEQKERRKKAAEDKLLEYLELEQMKKLQEINDEYAIKKQVLIIGGKKALGNCIYYTHTKQLAFNWRSYDKISDELINKIRSEIKLPDGATIENKNK